MKKLVMLVTMVLTLALSSMCFAAGDGSDLNRQQRIADKFAAVLSASDASGLAQVTGDLAPAMAQKITAENMLALQKEMREKLGRQKESKFAAYERFDQGDRITYLASYSKEKLVRVIYTFDKENKLVEFLFVPVQMQEEVKK